MFNEFIEVPMNDILSLVFLRNIFPRQNIFSRLLFRAISIVCQMVYLDCSEAHEAANQPAKTEFSPLHDMISNATFPPVHDEWVPRHNTVDYSKRR